MASLSPRKSIPSPRSVNTNLQSPNRNRNGNKDPPSSPRKKIDLSALSQSSYVTLVSLLETAMIESPSTELDFLSEELVSFFQYKSNLIAKNKPIPDEDSETFYEKIHSRLEQVVIEAVSMKDIEARNEKLKKIKTWYLDKVNTFKALSKIKERTTKNYDQIDDEEPKDEDKETLDEVEHRCQIFGFESAKNKINEFRRKIIINSPNIELDIDSDHYYFRSNRMKSDTNLDTFAQTTTNGFNSTFQTTKTSKFFNKTNNMQSSTSTGWFHPSTNLDSFDKEMKSTFSYYRPNYDYNNLMIEHDIVFAKNKQLMLERMNEEVKAAVNDFGVSRARYKANAMKTGEMKLLIKSYERNIETKSDEKKKEKKAVKKKSIVEATVEPPKEEERPKVDISKVKYITQYNEETDDKTMNFQDYLNKEKNKEKIFTINCVMRTEEEKRNMLTTQLLKKVEKDADIEEKMKTAGNEIEIEKEKKANVLPAESVLAISKNDSIFRLRMMNGKMNGLNVYEKDKHRKFLKPLSIYDNTYLKKESTNRPKTEENFMMETFSKFPNDYLKMRKTISKFNESQMKSSKIFKKSNHKFKIQLTRISSNPKTLRKFPQCYLPITGHNLLTNNI